jgi:chloride channel 3/4/5
MIVVMTSKWVGDALGKDGIYSIWIAMRKYPWIPPVEYKDRGETGAELMTPFEDLVVIEDGEMTLLELGMLSREYPWKRIIDAVGSLVDGLLKKHDFHGFPVVHQHDLLGYATRDKLQASLGTSIVYIENSFSTQLCVGTMLSEDLDSGTARRCIFSTRSSTYASSVDQVNLSETLHEAVIQLRKEVPQELVITMFQKLVCDIIFRSLSRYIFAAFRIFATSYSLDTESLREW